MDSPILAALVAAAATLLLVWAVQVATRRRRSRADLEARVASVQRENEDLRARLEELLAERAVPQVRGPERADFVITQVGEAGPGDVAADGEVVPDRLVLSATLGEPLVKVAAFSHGLRKALSAESRNRIWFEMRREARSARRQRLRLRKQLMREFRARERAVEDPA